MNYIVSLLLAILVQLLVIAGPVLALDNYALLKSGNEARDLGNLEQAAFLYQEYITCHPFSDPGDPHLPEFKYSQNYIRKLLKAYDSLFDIFRDNRNFEQIDIWKEKLAATYDPTLWGIKNRYTLARIYLENNWVDESINMLEKIISDHQIDYWYGNNKAFLRCVAKLADIYKQQGNSAKLESLYQEISKVPLYDFDIKDKLKIAKLYANHDAYLSEADSLLQEIFSESSRSAGESHSFYAAGKELMALQTRLGREEKRSAIIRKLKGTLGPDTSPAITYEIAIESIKGSDDEIQFGRKLLKDISITCPNTIWARKSLFILGRTAMNAENWPEVIQYYSSYVQRYPEQTFFSLKAYSNLLDAYWAQNGDLAMQDVEAVYFADILNDISDYETQLNLARDLFHKGYDELAFATFALGYKNAKERMQNEQDPLRILRVHWQITKYAFATDKLEIARQSGEKVIQIYAGLEGRIAGREQQTKADHYLSRTMLWLSKVYEKYEELVLARELLHNYVERFPGDPDVDYAIYQLANLYEKSNMSAEALKNYKKIKKGRWQKKAQAALQRMAKL